MTTANNLAFVDTTEAAIATWRAARDEVGQRTRIDTQVETDKAAYEKRTHFRMPSALEKEIRADLHAQETARADEAQAAAVAAYDAARKTITTVRTAEERLRPAWQVMKANGVADSHVESTRAIEAAEETNTAAWIRDGALRPIVERYLKSSDDHDRSFVRAVETAVELGISKFRAGSHQAREDADVLLKLQQAITQRQRARWPQWTIEAAERLAKALNVNDSAFLELRRQGRIA